MLLHSPDYAVVHLYIVGILIVSRTLPGHFGDFPMRFDASYTPIQCDGSNSRSIPAVITIKFSVTLGLSVNRLLHSFLCFWIVWGCGLPLLTLQIMWAFQNSLWVNVGTALSVGISGPSSDLVCRLQVLGTGLLVFGLSSSILLRFVAGCDLAFYCYNMLRRIPRCCGVHRCSHESPIG